mmetsp:Transcript_40837/g.91891  ORF Transcript_40837/g.91891 Transcript_40837/m.91891 type:complete len:219 (+) Transcript_40837:465-1121(+)
MGPHRSTLLRLAGGLRGLVEAARLGLDEGEFLHLGDLGRGEALASLLALLLLLLGRLVQKVIDNLNAGRAALPRPPRQVPGGGARRVPLGELPLGEGAVAVEGAARVQQKAGALGVAPGAGQVQRAPLLLLVAQLEANPELAVSTLVPANHLGQGFVEPPQGCHHKRGVPFVVPRSRDDPRLLKTVTNLLQLLDTDAIPKLGLLVATPTLLGGHVFGE